MKITAIQASNFIGARAVDVKLTKPVALFAGKNYAGKSSLQEAIRMALTGETVRVGLKKDYAALVTEGQEAGFVEVTTDDSTYSVVLPSGKGIHCDKAALSYVLDAQSFAHIPADDRRAFMFGLMGLRTDGADVKDRLIARGCDAKKVEHIAPFLRAGFDAGQKEAKAKGRECKAQWKTTTGGEAYGAVKAASFLVEKEEVDAGKLDQARADLVKIEEAIEADTGSMGELQGRARQAAEKAGKLAELREKAGRFARIQGKLNKDEADLKIWEEKVAATREKAGAGNVNPKAQGEFLLRGLASVTDDFLSVARSFPDPFDDGLINRAETHLGDYKKLHGWPHKTHKKEAADPEAAAQLPEYEQALKLMQSAVANGKRDLAAADAAACALRELEDSGMTEAPSDEEITALKARIDTLKHVRGNQQAGIRRLEDAERQAKEADEKTRRAAALHQDVQQWEAIADALAPDGIPGEMLTEALGPINDRLEQSSQDAEWLHVHVQADMSIFAAYPGLPPRPYALLSESEKWRADAMLAEAISHLSKTKLLVLDRFDVLDLKGREDLLYWLDGMAANGEINIALIFGTLKALPPTLPQTIAAHWLENGVVAQLKEAE